MNTYWMSPTVTSDRQAPESRPVVPPTREHMNTYSFAPPVDSRPKNVVEHFVRQVNSRPSGDRR